MPLTSRSRSSSPTQALSTYLLSLDDALSDLRDQDPRAAEIVEPRFFGGLTGPEIAEALAVSEITVKRDWRAARAWLLARLTPNTDCDEPF